MAGVSRREFLGKAGVGSAAAGFLLANGVTVRANPLGLPIGSQAYPHRARIAAGDFAGLLKDMKSIGIEVVELCNPTYADFKILADGKQTRKILDDSGIKCLSAHFQMAALRADHQRQIDWALALGMTQMNTASIQGQVINGVTSLDAVKRAADEYNKIGAVARKAGLQQVTHNEGFENSRLDDGRLTYPVLLQYLDPDLVKMQFQMSSMRTIGDPAQYFTMYPGRFISAHLQGVNLEAPMPAPRGMPMPIRQTAPPADAAGAGRGARAAGAAGGRAGGQGGGGGLALGEDTVDWVKVFTAAKIGGMKNYFVEQAWDITVRSVAFLKTLNV